MENNKPVYMLQNNLFQHFINVGILPALLLLALMLPTASIAQDSDGDGVDDTLDNCTEIANPLQYDSNGDGFGNICDADLDNNGLVSFADLNLFRAAFDTDNADADLDGSGRVSFTDLNIFRSLFDKPPGPAAENDGSISEAEAARFLTQTTFGPTFDGIQQLVALGNYETWLNEQFAMPVVLQQPQARLLSTNMCLDSEVHPDFSSGSYARRGVWWDAVIESDDQLRQRVAFALSQILVLGDQTAGSFAFGVTNYYDILLRNAFGNYRQLLEEVTLNPMMGEYLSHIMNQKADPDNNIFPDENYAREVLQLFSIGVHKLKPDGTLKMDAENNPIPSYGQNEVRAFARVFTGWVYHGNNGRFGTAASITPMEPVEERHDTDEKILLDGVVLQENQDTRTDLKDALDNIFNHPNVGPFISKQLIQRLVTSNPSADYVQRVASVFNSNGQGIRGDLKATVAAILLDSEARTRQADSTHSGKLREPLLRISHLWRTFGVTKIESDKCSQAPHTKVYGAHGSPFHAGSTGQVILQAPSVFNFFLPSHAPQGPVSDTELGLVAPEFQIFTESVTLKTISFLNHQIQQSKIAMDDDTSIYHSVLNLNDEVAWAENPEQMLDKLNLILLNGEMSGELRGILLNYLNTAPFPTNGDENLRTKLEDTVMLIINSPDYLIQK